MIDRPLTTSRITGGVDTHKDTHTAAALDATGRAIGNATFPASAAGYVQLLEWLRSLGAVDRVGIEGTGSYGVGLASFVRRPRSLPARKEEAALRRTQLRRARSGPES